MGDNARRGTFAAQGHSKGVLWWRDERLQGNVIHLESLKLVFLDYRDFEYNSKAPARQRGRLEMLDGWWLELRRMGGGGGWEGRWMLSKLFCYHSSSHPWRVLKWEGYQLHLFRIYTTFGCRPKKASVYWEEPNILLFLWSVVQLPWGCPTQNINARWP